MKSLALVSLLMIMGLPHAFALTASYEQSIYQNDEMVANFKITQQENHLRAESVLGEATTVILQNEQGNFTYFPEQNVGYKVPKGDAPNISQDVADYMGFLDRNQASKVGEETIGSYACTIYEFNDPISKLPSKAWVWTEKNFPVQVEVYAPEGTIRVAFENIQFDITPSEQTFQVPPDANVMDMSNMNAQQQASG